MNKRFDISHEKNLNSDLRNYRESELKILERYIDIVNKHADCPEILLTNIPRVMRTQEVTKIIVYYEIYKLIRHIHGDIVEIGVLDGFLTFAMAHFSEIFEHRNYTRKIWGFDTFSGYESFNEEKDKVLPPNSRSVPYSQELLQKCVDLFNASVVFNQFRKIELVAGDVVQSIPQFVSDNPHLVVSLLLLQISLYEPELVAFKEIWPRMPKGGVVVFCSMNYGDSPAATHVLLETVGISSVQIRRFPFSTKVSYIIKE